MLNWVTLKFYKTISTYKSFLKLKKVIVIALKAYLSDLAIYIASVTFFMKLNFGTMPCRSQAEPARENKLLQPTACHIAGL